VAKKGGALPAFAELEVIRREHGVPVRRFCARLGIPPSTWYHWRAGELRGVPVRRWPAPVVEAIAPRAAEEAHKYQAWGHRKIWAMLRADGVHASQSSVERALRRLGLLQPRRYQAERRNLARRRKAVFYAAPTRRNRVWQTDFTEFETTAGGTWRISPVLDYATKFCLASPIVGQTAARDAIEVLGQAIAEAEALLDRPLLEDCLDPETGELQHVVIVTDNGAAYKSLGYARYIAGRTELDHVRTRHKAPETNGVAERYNETLKYEHLYRYEIRDVLELQERVEEFRTLYNAVRPHEAIAFETPLKRYLATPAWPPRPHLSEGGSVQPS
jgi:transposase InsO family protein